MNRFLQTGWVFLGLALLPSCDKTAGLVSLVKEKAAAPAAPAPAYSGALVSELSAAEYTGFSDKPGRVVVIDFHADWCPPCKKLGPILDEIARENQGLVLVGKVNVDQCREIAQREGVQGIPDVRIFRDGRQVDKFVGLPPADQVKALIAKHTQGLSLAAADPEAPAAAPQPAITPGHKDWLPPGMKRR